MGDLSLSVQVHNISPKATKEDIFNLFQYCGTVEKIQLQREGDQTQTALVTFGQPYARQTGLLLNNATVVDRRVRISQPDVETNVPILPCSQKNTVPGTVGSYISKGAMWLSYTIHRASEKVAVFAYGKARNPNSRKQK